MKPRMILAVAAAAGLAAGDLDGVYFGPHEFGEDNDD